MSSFVVHKIALRVLPHYYKRWMQNRFRRLQ
jgi:hypothetical protein